MIDELIASDLPIWNAIFGILAAIVSLWFAFIKAKNIIYRTCIKPMVDNIDAFFKSRENERSKRIFLELEPMIEAHVQVTLQEHKSVLLNQQITLQSSISEGVEFKSFVSKNMISLQKSIEQLVVVVTQNTEDSRRVRDCLERIDGQSCPAYTIKPKVEDTDEA